MMNELIKVSYKNDRPTVSGRELHDALGIRTAYKDWFPRMREYGFIEGADFCSILSESTGGRPSMDHQLTIDMAKEICMIQRTDIGKKCREYFLELERRWNSPEAIMARALQFANNQLAVLREENTKLLETNAIQEQQIAEMKPKVTYYDIVLQSPSLIKLSVIAKDYGMSPRAFNKLLNELKVQYKQGDIWLLYSKYQNLGYTSTTTYVTGEDKNGNKITKCWTKWTQKGRLFLYGLLKQNGKLPLIELQDDSGDVG